jgi:hypothetical protein
VGYSNVFGWPQGCDHVCSVFPVAVLFYLEGAWLAYGIVEDAIGRDTYVEGIYHYPLALGYQLVIMDKIPEQAYARAPTTHHLRGSRKYADSKSLGI